MTKPFAAFDVDGTIFKSSLAEKVVESCIAAKVFDPEPFNEVFANRHRWQNNNNEGLYQAFLHRLVKTFVDQVAGIEVERFNMVTKEMLGRHAVRKFAFPRKLMNALYPSHYLIVISGSPDILVEPFVKELNVQTVFGSRFDVEDGRFTGEASSVGDKGKILRDLVEEGIILREGSVAIGDTVSDIPMLDYASYPIMFNASKTLTNYGSEFGWLRVNEVKDQITTLEWNGEIGRYIERDTYVAIARMAT